MPNFRVHRRRLITVDDVHTITAASSVEAARIVQDLPMAGDHRSQVTNLEVYFSHDDDCPYPIYTNSVEENSDEA